MVVPDIVKEIRCALKEMQRETPLHIDHKWLKNRLYVCLRCDGAAWPYNGLPFSDAVGFAIFDADCGPPDYMFVDNIRLIKTYRGLSWGYRMYMEGIKLAKEAGYKGIASETGWRSTSASKTWKRIPHEVREIDGDLWSLST